MVELQIYVKISFVIIFVVFVAIENCCRELKSKLSGFQALDRVVWFLSVRPIVSFHLSPDDIKPSKTDFSKFEIRGRCFMRPETLKIYFINDFY